MSITDTTVTDQESALGEDGTGSPPWSDREKSKGKSGTTLGTKLIYVLITGFVSLIPLLIVSGVLGMRNDYANEVIRDLENELGGQQRVFGPVIVVPTKWQEPMTTERLPNGTIRTVERGAPPDIYFMPEELDMKVDLNTKLFDASVYEVIGYESTVDLIANYGSLRDNAPFANGIDFLWEEAWLVLYLTNTASTKFRPELEIAGESIPLYAGLSSGNALFENNRVSFRRQPGSLYSVPTQSQGYSAKIGAYLDPTAATVLETQIAFNGATAFAVAPVGRDMALTVTSTQTPTIIRNFSADFDTIGRPQDAEAFSNIWNTAGPYRSGRFQDVRRDTASALLAKQDFVIEFDPGNIRPYADIARALQYGFFLMGFSFLTFFMFEAMSKRYLHTAQYFLLGLIQTIFYALLLGVAEFIGFDRGFLLSAFPTIAVTGLAVGSILRSIGIGVLAIFIFAAFYAVQYVLMDMAQYSLLVAAGASFLAIAIALIITSRMDWSKFGGGRELET